MRVKPSTELGHTTVEGRVGCKSHTPLPYCEGEGEVSCLLASYSPLYSRGWNWSQPSSTFRGGLEVNSCILPSKVEGKVGCE